MNRTVLGFGLICVGAFLLAAVLIAQSLAVEAPEALKSGVLFFSVVAGIVCMVNFVVGYGCLISDNTPK